ncbi:MAG: beta family protein [Tepidisphaeraceae bacterium]|jgi:hypothetical protein
MLKFGQKHYVPILKTKEGERWAIFNLDAPTKLRLTPLMEIHEHKTLTAAQQALAMCQALAHDWGTDRPLFLDTCWLHDEHGHSGILAAVFQSARIESLQAIPVARTSYGQQALARIRDIAQQDGRGYLLRAQVSDLSNPAGINSVLSAIGLQRQHVHFMLDYRNHPMNLLVDVPRIPSISSWLTLTTASSACPRSLTSFQQHIWHPIPRNDWTSWEQAVTQLTLPRRPTFSDYTIRDYGRSPSGGRASVTLRYTTTNNWLIRVGPKVAGGGSVNMHVVCQSLIQRTEYSGQNFSAGDGAIHATAQPNSGPGNTGQWISWGASHHMVFVARQIQNHAGL